MPAQVELRLGGNLDHLRVVWQSGESVLEIVQFRDDPEGTRYNVLVALQEMVTNVYRHGYGGDETRPLAVAFEATPERFMVHITDDGPPFDPRSVAPPVVDDGGPPTDCGGFGIMIARAVMDALDYERVDGKNVLTMTKLATGSRAGEASAHR